MMNDGYYGWGMGWGFPFMGPIFFILFILGVIYLFKIIFGNKEKENKTENEIHLKPLDILKQRYARGDIDQATYDRMKRELN